MSSCSHRQSERTRKTTYWTTAGWQRESNLVCVSRDVGIPETGYCEASESMSHSRYMIWVGGAYSRKYQYFGGRCGLNEKMGT